MFAQILALERAQQKDVISWKIYVHDDIRLQFDEFAMRLPYINVNRKHNSLLQQVLCDCYQRLVVPMIERGVKYVLSFDLMNIYIYFRRTLIDSAEKAAIECFAKNLRQLLLAKPLKHIPILGIDPGWKHGCKVALISKSSMLMFD